MNQEQFITLLRQTLIALSAGFVTKGYVDDATLQMIVSGLVGLATVAWGLYVRRKAGLISAAATSALKPTERVVLTDQAKADAIASIKVVGPAQAKVVGPAG
jgi:hypothetical protein